MKMERTELVRANRVAVSVVEGIYKADFYRTHKKLTTILSTETGWEADNEMNKSAQREDFRKYVVDHADSFGIEWNPADMRTDNNKRVAKYENDFVLATDTIEMLKADILTLIEKTPYDIQYKDMDVDAIKPVLTTAKGTDLSKLGVIDGKYEKSGNWAWADIDIVVILTMADTEIYYTTTSNLVSGQLKKPHITQTSFNEDIKTSLMDAGIVIEESKEEPKAEPEVKDAKTTKSKGKGKGKSSKKSDK
jgi:hypothetical protein